MADEKQELNILDYLVIFVKYKKFLLGTTLILMVVFYLLILFFVEEQFDSKTTIIPAQDQSLGGIASMLGSLGSQLPFDIGSASSPEIGLYKTILNSRTLTDSTIKKFNLYKIFHLDKNNPKQIKLARERFQESIKTEETDDGAFIIKVRMPDTLLSANIANYLVTYLNNKIIELKVKKSRENRIFLENRIVDIRKTLRNSEDSLKNYQTKSGMLVPEEQIKGILTTYSLLEKELLTKKMQKDVLIKIYGDNAPQVQSLKYEVKEFENKLSNLKRNGEKNSIFLAYKSIPEKAVEYYRLLREVEINNKILEFVLPLYEQAKFEEQKDIPVLQVIDKAKPAEVKDYPPRSLLTLLFGISTFLILFIFVLIINNRSVMESEQLNYFKKNLFKWNTN